MSPLLCLVTADDWGISPSVNEGILKLAERGIVRRVSVMAPSEFANTHLSNLKALTQVQTGLHFNLTYRSSVADSPSALLTRWMTSFGRSKRELIRMIREELEKQIAAMKDLGLKISHFDGHEHVQIVPGLVASIADILHREGIEEIRLPFDFRLVGTSKFPIVLLSLLLRRSLNKNRFRYLPFFYPQRKLIASVDLKRELFKREGYEILFHPSVRDDFEELKIEDSYSKARVFEFERLMQISS